jgi:hypothetical protein
MDDIRTNVDIVRDLLEHVEHHTWVEHYKSCGRGCCGETVTICGTCGADEGDDEKPDEYQKHKPDCRLAKLIAEAEAFIRIEEQLEYERENPREVHPEHRPTSWEHVSNG